MRKYGAIGLAFVLIWAGVHAMGTQSVDSRENRILKGFSLSIPTSRASKKLQMKMVSLKRDGGASQTLVLPSVHGLIAPEFIVYCDYYTESVEVQFKLNEWKLFRGKLSGFYPQSRPLPLNIRAPWKK